MKNEMNQIKLRGFKIIRKQILRIEKLKEKIEIMAEYQKQNIGARKIHKFQSFENAKGNKFQAHKIQRNVLIGRSDNFSSFANDDYDYVQTIVPNKISTGEQQKLSPEIDVTEDVDNLCDLWEKLGQGEEPNPGQTESLKIETTQLTEEELMQCFGDESSEAEEKNQIQAQRSKQNQNSQVQTKVEEIVDQDLMAIWGDETEQKKPETPKKTPLISEKQTVKPLLKQQVPTPSKKQQQKQSEYCWQQEVPDVKMKSKQFQTLESLQEEIKEEDSFQMELEDPNKLKIGLRKYNKTSMNVLQNLQENSNSNILTAQTLNSAEKGQAKVVSISQVSELDTKRKSQLKEKEKSSTHISMNAAQKQTDKGPSIVKEILLENNNKTMTKLIPGKDYDVYYPKMFVLSQFKPDSYSYFGIEVRSSSLLDVPKETNSKHKLKQDQPNIFYFYAFQTKEAFLELKPEPFLKQYNQFLSIKKTITYGPGQTVVKNVMEYSTDACFKVRVCSTKQHIATMFYKVIKDGYLFDLRLYDSYQKIHSEPIALIQVKDGFVNECCYCDTNVFIQKKTIKHAVPTSSKGKPHKNDLSLSYIEKLKMILNIKNGKLTANMGINGIDSSPYNCCLEHQESKKFIYLMGLLSEETSETLPEEKNEGSSGEVKERGSGGKISSKNEVGESVLKRKNNNRFIIKVGEGVSPLLGLAITAGRKLYIDSFE